MPYSFLLPQLLSFGMPLTQIYLISFDLVHIEIYSIFDLGCSLLDAKVDTGSLQIKNREIPDQSGLNILMVNI